MTACRWKGWEGDVLPPYVAFEERWNVPDKPVKALDRLTVSFLGPAATAPPGIRFLPIDLGA